MFTRLKLSTGALCTLFVLFVLSLHAPSYAMQAGKASFPQSGLSLLDVLNHQEVVNMTIVAELDSLIQNRRTEEFRAATLTFSDEFGAPQSYQIKIKPRGKFRRRICDFPPLKLKFSKKELEVAGLEQFNDLKLVTHCLEDESKSKELILKEYLTYRMYNELTPNSFRVQLVNLTYQDADKKDYNMTRWGFLIEDTEELANRLAGVEVDSMGQLPEHFNVSHERITSLFQYMIGNTDWSLVMNRNVKLFRKADGKLVPVPYDFDFSVFVGAPYTRPNMDVGQTVKMERIFMGHAANAGDLYSTCSYFRSKKQALIDIIRRFNLLSEESREGLVQYLDSFFTIIQSQESVQKAMFSNG
jgi:hypothetical protein